MFTIEEKELLLRCISNEQICMIIKEHTMYENDDYKKLEELKIKIKDIRLSPTEIWNRIYMQNTKL